MNALRCLSICGLLVGLLLLAACNMPRFWIEAVTPTAGGLARTPAPLPSRLPTPCASARVAGKSCLAGADVYLTACCPDWEAVTISDAGGGFAFEALTVGTFTVTAGSYSRQVTIKYCDSQVNVDLCPPPTPGTGP